MFSSRKSSKSKDANAFGLSTFGSRPASSVVVTVKTVQKPRPAPSTLKLAAATSSDLASAPTSSSSSPSPSKPSTPSQKRKRTETPELTSDAPTKLKARRLDRSISGSPAPRLARSQRHRIAFGSLEKPIARPCISRLDGNVPHLSSEDIVRRINSEATSGKKGKVAYRAYFRNPHDPNDQSFEPSETSPVVVLEYPNHGASERFPLVFPSDRDDYQPIRELMKIIGVISECYLTPEKRIPLGSLSTSSAVSSAHLNSPALTPSTPISRSNSPALQGTLTPSELPPSTDPLLRTLEKAYHTRNGPLFVQTIEQISTHFKGIKDEMLKNASLFFQDPSSDNNHSDDGTSQLQDKPKGIPVKLWKTILEEVYQRSVGPDIDETKKYKSFSSETYGELCPPFVSDLIHRFDLGPGKTFVDLGSGVGNCVLQAALQAGCDSYGIEINTPVAALSFKQEAEFHARLRMWGLSAGPLTLREGNFIESPEVAEWIRKADVVLVNNYIFSSDLNDALTWRFLDLREGAKVVVLKPFWPLNRPLTERTAYSPEAVLAANVERIEYITGSVSWTNESGEFFIYTKTEARPELASEQSRRSSNR